MTPTWSQAARNELPNSKRQLIQILIPRTSSTGALQPQKTQPSSHQRVAGEHPTTKETLVSSLGAVTSSKQASYAKVSIPAKPLPTIASPLLGLPVEIRTRIYKLVLTFEEPIQITQYHRHPFPFHTTNYFPNHFPETYLAKTDPSYRRPIGGRSALSISFTCRQIYLESISLYYSLNVFQYISYGLSRTNFHEFMRSIGPANRNFIHQILFIVDGDCNGLMDLGHMPALKCLTIVLGWPADRCRWSGVPKEALERLGKMSGTLERVKLVYGGPQRGNYPNMATVLNEKEVQEINELLRKERGRKAGTGAGTT